MTWSSSRAQRATETAAYRHALAAWSNANRLACEAEAAVLRAELAHLRGEGRAPGPLLHTRANHLRELANELRAHTVIDFVRTVEAAPQRDLERSQWPRPRARSSTRSALSAPRPQCTELAEPLSR